MSHNTTAARGPPSGALAGAAQACGLADVITQQCGRLKLLGQVCNTYHDTGMLVKRLLSGGRYSPGTLAAWMVYQAVRPVHIPYCGETLSRWVSHIHSFLQRDSGLFEGRCSGSHLYSLTLEKRLARDSGGRDMRSVLHKRFPRKLNPLASKKVNVFLDELLVDISQFGKSTTIECLNILARCKPGVLWEDQVCSAIIWSFCVAPHLQSFSFALEFSLLMISCPEAAKGLNDILKSLGWNHSDLGASLVEMNCLLGRGTGDLDLSADIASRLIAAEDKKAQCDDGLLRQTVKKIFLEELGNSPIDIPSSRDHFNHRFVWCVAGSHPRGTNKAPCFEGMPAKNCFGDRWNRRTVSEYIRDDPLPQWAGRVGVSPSLKLEHGKTRAIYACDTVCYYAFTRLLRPVEKAWAGMRVVLDPGRGGTSGMDSRIRSLIAASHPICVALDYSDFNSQHSLRAQKIVIEELIKHTRGVLEHEKESLINSFDRMFIYYGGREVGKVGGTLMSGHRGTSFINSVLNAAYIRIALGETWYHSGRFLHVGDDVFCAAPDYRFADRAVDGLRDIGCRLTDSKQSVGENGYEFLRMAGSSAKVRGYLCRAIAGGVSGSWVGDTALEPTEALESYLTFVRSIINRSTREGVHKLFSQSLSEVCGLPVHICRELLSGDVACNNGPCYRNDGRYFYRRVQCVPVRDLKDPIFPKESIPSNATHDYFTFALTPVERLAVTMVGYYPWRAALRSSYGDLHDGKKAASGGRKLIVGPMLERTKVGTVRLDSLNKKDVQHGVLAHLNVISLLRNVLCMTMIRTLLSEIGAQWRPGHEYITAFGAPGEGATIIGCLPYGEAAATSQYSLGNSILVDRQIAA